MLIRNVGILTQVGNFYSNIDMVIILNAIRFSRNSGKPFSAKYNFNQGVLFSVSSKKRQNFCTELICTISSGE